MDIVAIDGAGEDVLEGAAFCSRSHGMAAILAGKGMHISQGGAAAIGLHRRAACIILAAANRAFGVMHTVSAVY